MLRYATSDLSTRRTSTTDVYTDITDGWRCRSHEHLMRKATAAELEENVIRIGLGVHNDDVTFANPIGTKRGEHKDSITDANILNLPLIKRHSFEYIMLLSVVNSKTLKDRGGLEWSFCGVNEKGEESVKDSLAAAGPRSSRAQGTAACVRGTRSGRSGKAHQCS